MENKVYNKRLIPSSDFVHKETGETMSSFIGDEKDKYVSVLDTSVKDVSYSSYFTTNLNAIKNVTSFLIPSEAYKMNILIWSIGTDMNFVLKSDGSVAQRSDLPEILGISTSRVDVLLAKLIRLNVVYVMSGYKGKRRFKAIMINPHIAKRGKRFDSECLKHFYDPSSIEYVNEMNEYFDIKKNNLNK